MADSPAEDEEFTPSEAQLHELLTTFMGRLRQATQVSGNYQKQLEQSAVQMAGAHDLLEVDSLLKDLLKATKTMARDSLGVHDELRGMQERVHTTDQQIARLHAELDRLNVLARHDPLTGALNRRGLDESLNREVSKVRRMGTVLSVAMLDIDDFKRLNVSLGHAAGDAALRHLAVVARQVLRPQDTVARYGGEEFAVILPDTPISGAEQLAEQIRKSVADSKIRMTTRDEIVSNITASFGVACFRPGESMEDFIARADKALYASKQNGRNRVSAEAKS